MNPCKFPHVLTAIYGCTILLVYVRATADYYTTLGVPKTASQQEIKRAFRNLALKYHPDKNKDANANEMFQQITKAYTTLHDPEKRRMYDMTGQPLDSPGGFDVNSFFKQFDDALKQSVRQGKGDKQSESFKTGNSGGFFDFNDLFSGMDDNENNLFASFGNILNGKSGKKKASSPMTDKFSELQDMLNTLSKAKDVPKKHDKGQPGESNQGTDFTHANSPEKIKQEKRKEL